MSQTHLKQGDLMSDKSPRKPSGKKAGKSLKEKREVKREKKDSAQHSADVLRKTGPSPKPR